MIRKFKATAVVLSAAMVFSGMIGCGGEASAPAPVEETVDMDDADEGSGDAIEDETASEEEEAVMNVLAIKGPSYTGLSNLKNENNEDGSYFYEDMTEDGITIITNMCARNSQRDGQDPDAYVENFVCAMIDNDAKITESKAKAHNRDFYKRPVAVASAGAGAGASAAAASHVSVSTGGGGSSVIQQQQNISHSTTNFNFSGTSGSSGVGGGFSSAGAGVSAGTIHTGTSGILDSVASTGAGVVSGEGLAAAGILAAGAAVAGAAIMSDVKKGDKEDGSDKE